MKVYFDKEFPAVARDLHHDLLEAPEVDVGEWHAMDVRGNDMLVSRELREVIFSCFIPGMSRTPAAHVCQPNLPWADEHFAERVSGKPLNPPPSHVNWPWASANEKHQTADGGAFSHSYPERFWPKSAGERDAALDEWDQAMPRGVYRAGIRFPYGDLGDVVNMLARSPYTRQAVLPVWFPEDTGGVHGERVPCTLIYHWMLRDGHLHCFYDIRSCDFVRYFRDDVYFAMRLTQWLIEQLRDREANGPDPLPDPEVWSNTEPGDLTMRIGSLHVFNGDLPKLRRELEETSNA